MPRGSQLDHISEDKTLTKGRQEGRISLNVGHKGRHKVKFLVIYVNNRIQIHLNLPNLIKPKLKLSKVKVNFELLM